MSATPKKNGLGKGNAIPNDALIKLDGTLIKADGETYKSTFFDFLEISLDDYSNITYTPEEARKIKRHLQHLSTGSSAAIPILCGGAARCPWAERCPFLAIDRENKQSNPEAKSIVSIGKACLLELNLLNEWTRLYVMEYEIEENSFTEFQMVRELAEIELMLWRINNNLAKPERAPLVQRVDIGTDREGNVLQREEISAFFEAKEKLQNRKSRIIKLLVGDRQEKYKKEAALKTRDSGDPSSSAAQLKQHIISQLRALQTHTRQLQELEGSPDIIEADAVLSPEDIIGENTSKE